MPEVWTRISVNSPTSFAGRCLKKNRPCVQPHGAKLSHEGDRFGNAALSRITTDHNADDADVTRNGTGQPTCDCATRHQDDRVTLPRRWAANRCLVNWK